MWITHPAAAFLVFLPPNNSPISTPHLLTRSSSIKTSTCPNYFIVYPVTNHIPRALQNHEFMSIENLKTFGESKAQPLLIPTPITSTLKCAFLIEIPWRDSQHNVKLIRTNSSIIQKTPSPKPTKTQGRLNSLKITSTYGFSVS